MIRSARLHFDPGYRMAAAWVPPRRSLDGVSGASVIMPVYASPCGSSPWSPLLGRKLLFETTGRCSCVSKFLLASPAILPPAWAVCWFSMNPWASLALVSSAVEVSPSMVRTNSKSVMWISQAVVFAETFVFLVLLSSDLESFFGYYIGKNGIFHTIPYSPF